MRAADGEGKGRTLGKRTKHRIKPAGGRLALGAAVAAALLLALSLGAWRRNLVWASEGRLWRDTLLKAPLSGRAHFNWGTVLEHRGDLTAAVHEYRLTMRLSPGFSDAHVKMGNLLWQRGRPGEARAGYEQALAINPRNAKAWVGMGLTLAAGKEYEGAEQAFRNAIRFGGRGVERGLHLTSAYYNLGNLLGILDRLDEAEEAYRRSLAINPDRALTHRKLADVYRRGMRLEEAERHYRRALVLGSRNPQAHYYLGVLLWRRGDLEEARRLLDEARSLGGGEKLRTLAGEALAELEREYAARRDEKR